MLALLAVTKLALTAARFWVCFAGLRVGISALGALLYATTTILLALVNLTPGSMGLREVAVAALSAGLGTTYAAGMAAASLDRVGLLAYVVIAGLPGLYRLRQRKVL